MNINTKKILTTLICCLTIVAFQSCKKEDSHHPITWTEWTDATETKLLRFSHNGRYRDLYDYMHTRKDKYVIGEKIITIYHSFNANKDTTKAKIIKLDSKNLVLKYDNGFVEKLKPATKLQLLIGRWTPNFDEANTDTFEICKPQYDSKLRNYKGETRAFHYSVVNDTTLTFDFFQEGMKETINYFISEDCTMLLLKYKNVRISLVRS